MTLFYSGGCKFCRWVARTIVPLIDPTRQMDVLPFRHPLARLLLGEMDIETIKQHWWYRDKTGKLWAGNKGGAKQLLLDNGQWWAKVIPSILFDKADDWVNNHRPFLSRWVDDGPATFIWQGEKEEPVYGWEAI